MNARRIRTVLLLVTMISSVWYFFAYLSRWEWNRALIAGVVVVAAEVGLATILVLSRLDDLKRRTSQASDRADRIQAHLEAYPSRSQSFEWLRRPEQVGVFVPVLLGVGVIVSALAWVVERLARISSRPGDTTALSQDLAALAPPAGGFLAGDDPIDLLRRPGGG